MNNYQEKSAISLTLDSGESYHMTRNLENLKDIKKHKEILTFADGGTVESELLKHI